MSEVICDKLEVIVLPGTVSIDVNTATRTDMSPAALLINIFYFLRDRLVVTAWRLDEGAAGIADQDTPLQKRFAEAQEEEHLLSQGKGSC